MMASKAKKQVFNSATRAAGVISELTSVKFWKSLNKTVTSSNSRAWA